MSTYRELITLGEKQLLTVNSSYEARLLMLELLRERQLDLYLIEDKPANPAVKELFLAGLKRLIAEEPLAYILGYTWFYGRKYQVNQRVLIPRRETEQLVGEALIEIEEYFTDLSDLTILDVGTGSGVIALSLALELPNTQVWASDISTEALAVAKTNAKELNAPVNFLAGDLLTPIIEQKIKLDVLVCNPPYIDQNETIPASVANYEPALALYGLKTGLYFYEAILAQAPKVLKQKSLVIFEIGYKQQAALTQLSQKYLPTAKTVTLKDYQGLDRFFIIYLQEKM